MSTRRALSALSRRTRFLLAAHQPEGGWWDWFELELMIARDQRSDWPELLYMTSTGLPATSEPGNGEARRPKGHEVGATPLGRVIISLRLTRATCRFSSSRR